jgi:hypothetical protein
LLPQAQVLRDQERFRFQCSQNDPQQESKHQPLRLVAGQEPKVQKLSTAIDRSHYCAPHRVAELKATRDQARLDAERTEDAIDRAGPTITPQALKTFARAARRRMRTANGGYRRDHLRALAERIEVDQKELRIMGSKSVLLRTLVAASSVKTAGFGVPSERPETIRTSDPQIRSQSAARAGGVELNDIWSIPAYLHDLTVWRSR